MVVDPHGETAGDEFPRQVVDLVPVVGIGGLQFVSSRVSGWAFEQARLKMEETHPVPPSS